MFTSAITGLEQDQFSFKVTHPDMSVHDCKLLDDYTLNENKAYDNKLIETLNWCHTHQMACQYHQLIHSPDHPQEVLAREITIIPGANEQYVSVGPPYPLSTNEDTSQKVSGGQFDTRVAQPPGQSLRLPNLQNLEEMASTNLQLSSYLKGLDRHAIISRTDRNGIITFVNQRFCEVSGFERSELIGRAHNVVNSAYHSKSFFRELWETISSGEIWRGQIRNLRKDGSTYWVDTTITPTIDSNGNILEYISFRYDITAWKHNEIVMGGISRIRKAYIEASEEDVFKVILKETLNVSNSKIGFIGMISEEIPGKPSMRPMAISDISWDKHSSQLFQKNFADGSVFDRLDNLIGEGARLAQTFWTNDPKHHPAAKGVPVGHVPLKSYFSAPILREGKVIALLGLANRPSGYNEYFRDTIQPLIDVVGEVLAYRRLEMESRDQREENRLALESLKMGFWRINLDTGHNWSDRACYELFDAEEDDRPLRDIWEERLHPLDRESKVALWEDAQKNRTGYRSQFRIILPSGETRFLQTWADLIPDPDGRSERIVGILWDETETQLARLELENQKKLAVHQSRLAAIGELAAGVGHEINNPLTIAQGFTDLIEKELNSPSPDIAAIQEMLLKLQGSTDRIEIIVKGLRAMSHIDAEVQEVFNPVSCIEETLNFVREIYRTRGIHLVLINQLEQPTMVLGHRGKLQQVLMNLLTNARDATTGIPNPEIQVVCNTEEQEFVIRVTDNGTGIEPALQDRIFDPFFSTKPVNEGTGIGLSIAHSMISEMDGSLTLSSEVGNGATFFVRVPINILPQPRQREASTQEYKALKGHILVVDDEEALRNLFQMLLEGFGLTTELAGSGEEALSLIQSNPDKFDLLITDFTMPGMNGLQLIEKWNEFNPERPAVITTGLVDVTGGLGIHVPDHVRDIIAKPFHKKEVYETLFKLLPENEVYSHSG